MPITGRNAKRVLFGAIDLGSARRVVLIRPRAGQADAQAFLRTLRRRYRCAGWLWLLTDRASAHTAPQTQALAARLRIRFVWLPRLVLLRKNGELLMKQEDLHAEDPFYERVSG